MESNTANGNKPDDQQVPTQIVCLYAMRDEPMYRELQTHLVLWHAKGHIRWLELSAGTAVEQTLLAFVQQADLILLLVSSSFFATSMLHRAMEHALAEQAKRGVPVVPILARAFDWKESACGSLNALPDNELPIAEWEYQERAYENIRAGLVRLIPNLATHMASLAIRPKHFQARGLPKEYIPRPKAFNEMKHLLLHRQGNQTTAITTALRGAGGFGKTTLALALCHDHDIQAAFPDGILWVELGEQPPRSLEVLNGVFHALEPSLPGAITLEEARDRWHTALERRVCLLVIDDVWQATALEPLLEGGPQCVRLVTTRNDQVLPEEAKQVWVDAMEPEEASSVLCRGLPDKIQHVVYQARLKELAKRLGYWPLLLTLAHGMLISFVKHGQNIEKALTNIEKAYQARGVTAFHQENADERQKTADACLEVSLRHLKKITPPHYNAVIRYYELAVFPEDTDIPLTTLRTYWRGTGELENWETEDLCVCLDDLSLTLSTNLGKGTIRLHDVLSNYLIQHAGPELPKLHTQLLDSYQQELSLTHWADLPRNEAYLWHHLIFHLYQASRQEMLLTTLTDLMYLTRKVLYVGISALETDLLLAGTLPSTQTTDLAMPFYASLLRSIVRISHLLRQTQTEAEMGGLLLSHLGWEPTFAAQRLLLERRLPRPFLTAWHLLPSRASSALLRTLHGHALPVNGCAVSPDGKWIVSASNDRTLKVWDAATGAQCFSLSGHTAEVNDCAVSSDSSFIVSASNDRTLKVWDAATGILRHTLSGHTDNVSGCAVGPDGRWVTSASWDKTLKIWDAATGILRHTLSGHILPINGCAVSPDGSFIVSASDDRTLKVWDTATGVLRHTLSGHTDWVNGCAVSPDGSFIVSASADYTLKVWDTATGVLRHTLWGHTNKISSCAVSSDGSFIVSASVDRTLKMWDTITGTERLSLWGHTNKISSCGVSPDSRFIVSASADHTLKMWDTITETERLSFLGHTDWVNDCAVSPDGSFIVSASADHTLKVWDATTGTERLSLLGHSGNVSGCAVGPDGTFIVSASWDETLKVWDATTGTERLSLSGHMTPVYGCAVSSDGSFIVSASNDRTLKVWDTATGVLRHTLSGHTTSVYDCAVSSDGSFIVSASDDHTLKVWDTTTGVLRHTLWGHMAEVNDCAVSSDGSFIVSASDDYTLKVWDTATGTEHLSLLGHSDRIFGCAVSPDGKWIVSASWDKTLKVWDAQMGQCMLTFPVDEALNGCAISPDGEHLVACGNLGIYFLRLVM